LVWGGRFSQGPDRVPLRAQHPPQRGPGAAAARSRVGGAPGGSVKARQFGRLPGQHQRVNAAEHAQAQRAAPRIGQVPVEHVRDWAPGQQVVSGMVEQPRVQRAAQVVTRHRLPAQPPRGGFGRRLLLAGAVHAATIAGSR
jgi:hypothetical protein